MRKLLSVILWSALMIVSMPLSTMAGRADYRVIPLPKSIQADAAKVFTLQPGMTIAAPEHLFFMLLPQGGVTIATLTTNQK